MNEKIKKYIDLNSLPKIHNHIDWKNSIGHELNFRYRNITGVIKITNYEKETQFVTFLYKGNEYILRTSQLANCSFGRILKSEYVESTYKYNIGDIINNKKGDFIITDRYIEQVIEKRNEKQSIYNVKKYKYKCLKCGYEDVRKECELDRACNACYKIPRKVIIGINDIPTTDPWMIDFFPGGYEEASKYNARSNKKVLLKCPFCGEISKIPKSINTLYYSKSFSCNCKDGISYPNKFSYEFLKQLPVENIIHEWTADWLSPYSYDNYFEYKDKKYFMEMDGILGHGNRTWGMKKDIDGLKRDEYKDKLAKEHNINVIRIDARESSLKYIKDNIINSELSILFDLSIVDWDRCDEFAHKNIVKEICIDKEVNNLSVKDLVIKYGLHKRTIRNYLHIGNKYNWCSYNGKDEISKLAPISKTKPIICNDKYVFDSVRTLCDVSENVFNFKIKQPKISRAISQFHGKYKGLLFKYIDKSSLDYYINNDNYIFYSGRYYAMK